MTEPMWVPSGLRRVAAEDHQAGVAGGVDEVAAGGAAVGLLDDFDSGELLSPGAQDLGQRGAFVPRRVFAETQVGGHAVISAS
ncbi:hypothetical protein ACFV2H_03205 [Streptomyces sp. NPDC059629]|uniref:hypothetical protein n=1 Tax=Streptomyces sp. NPDC059629 TaxID=3346889 RepID=UPI0036C109B9